MLLVHVSHIVALLLSCTEKWLHRWRLDQIHSCLTAQLYRIHLLPALETCYIWCVRQSTLVVKTSSLMFTAWTDERYHAYFRFLVTVLYWTQWHKLHAVEHSSGKYSSNILQKISHCCMQFQANHFNIHMHVPTCTCVAHHNTRFEGIQDWRCQRRGQPH